MSFDVLTSPGANDLVRIVGGVVMQDVKGPPAQAIVTGNTITIPTNAAEVRLTLAGAATGVILPAGSFHGQLLFVTIETAAANTLTFAAVATSNAAGGTTYVLSGLETHLLRWNALAATPAWYLVGPAAN